MWIAPLGPKSCNRNPLPLGGSETPLYLVLGRQKGLGRGLVHPCFKEETKIEKWCNICEHSFPSQLKFANHLRRKDEFGQLCRPPPGKADNFLSGIINYTQESSKPKKSRRIGIIRKGTRQST